MLTGPLWPLELSLSHGHAWNGCHDSEPNSLSCALGLLDPGLSCALTFGACRATCPQNMGFWHFCACGDTAAEGWEELMVARS